jgi:ketosteroid isomerase-like protein
VARTNLELVRKGFEDLNETGVEAMLPLFDPEFVLITPPELTAEPDTYRGPDGIRRYFDSFYEAMDEIRFEPTGFHEVGERVVVEFTLRARGRTTGIVAEQRGVQVWELREGKAVRLEVYPSLEEALEAARLGGGVSDV